METTRKIALITDDGETISQHFGRAAYYLVVTVQDGQIVNRELRPKPGHRQFAGQHGEEHHGPGHGTDPASHDKHVQMAEAIRDCEVVVCRGMGQGAYNSMQQLGIRPILTDIATIDQAVQAYLRGQITDRTDLLH